MAESFIKTYKYDNGEIQRIQVVKADSFGELDFLFPEESDNAFHKIVNLYRNFIVPKCPWVFGRMVLFHIPKDMRPITIPKREDGFSHAETAPVNDHSVNEMSDEAELASFLRKYVRFRKSGLRYGNKYAEKICKELIERGFLEVVSGRLPGTKLLPVGNRMGLLSESMPDAEVRVNSNFFVFDCFDVTSVFDEIGVPIGLMVKNGIILNPPAYNREAFLVHGDGRIEIRSFGIDELTVRIGEAVFDSSNSTVYERPSCCRVHVGSKGKYVVIVGCRVHAVFTHGSIEVPSSGFVLRIPESSAVSVGESVVYGGLEDICFGIQTGNSIIINGVKTKQFISDFYNIYRNLGMRSYPPGLYPLDYQKARAPRIGIGATQDGKPCIIWAEGPAKTGYVPGESSCGASLAEMAEIAQDIGLVNAVNLDGGGSAQILLRSKRELRLSDRNPKDNSEVERAVPAGIFIKAER